MLEDEDRETPEDTCTHTISSATYALPSNLQRENFKICKTFLRYSSSFFHAGARVRFLEMPSHIESA
jgi:hypothetical protein